MLGFTDWVIGFIHLHLRCRLCAEPGLPTGAYCRAYRFPVANVETNKMEDEWAVHQIKDDGQFCHGHPVVSWLVGGLNFQIEHQSFPQDISCSLSRDQQDHPEGLPGVWARLIEYPECVMP